MTGAASAPDREDLRVDVCIVGGGPAGATVAAWLARCGHRVAVIERSAHAGPPRGETLHAGAWPLLDHLGVTGDVLATGARRIHRSHLRWASERTEIRVHEPATLAVIRPALDAALLDIARRSGAIVLSPARAADAVRDPDGWSIAVESVAAGAPRRVRATLVADASGRAAWRRGPRAAITLRTFAIRGWWQLSTPVRDERWTSACVEALPEAWLWGSPAGATSYAAIAVVDGDSALSPARYRDCLAASVLLRDLPDHAQLVGPLEYCDATGHAPEAACEDGLFRVGDASCSIDPLSSAGLHIALGSAIHAGCAIHTLLRHPDRAPLVRAFHEGARQAAIARHRTWAARLYGESRWSTPFWTRRATPPAAAPAHQTDVDFDPASTHLALAAGISLRELPCIVDGVIEARLGVASPLHDRSLIWVHDTAVAPLVAPLAARPMTPAELLAGWQAVPAARRRPLLGALLDLGIVRPVAARSIEPFYRASKNM